MRSGWGRLDPGPEGSSLHLQDYRKPVVEHGHCEKLDRLDLLLSEKKNKQTNHERRVPQTHAPGYRTATGAHEVVTPVTCLWRTRRVLTRCPAGRRGPPRWRPEARGGRQTPPAGPHSVFGRPPETVGDANGAKASASIICAQRGTAMRSSSGIRQPSPA